jgi:sugar (pentulose or hexulose) kinase
MNVTVATEMVRNHYGLSHAQFEKAAAKVRPGSDGLILLPYLEGERTPNVPDGTGVWFGANPRTQSTGHFARAAMEGVTLGMNYGLRRLATLGVKPKQIRATGGGSQSKLWRQIMADVFNAEVVTLAVSEGAAYGAALQAMWCVAKKRCEKVSINDFSDQFVKLNSRETTHPKKENVAVYRKIQAIQGQLSTDLRGVFSRHRSFLGC